MDWGVLIPLTGIAATVVLCFPLVSAAVRHIERKSRGQPTSDEIRELREDLSLIQDRLASLDMSEDRLIDLEERVDFAERLITRERESRLVEGKH